MLKGRPLAEVPQTAGESVTESDPIKHLRILALLTSNVSLNAGRTIAAGADRDIASLRRLQIIIGLGTVVGSLALGWVLVRTARRQTGHFRSLVTSSTDLVIVLGDGGCRYVSDSVVALLGAGEDRMLGVGLCDFVHPEDCAVLESAGRPGEPQRIGFRLLSERGEWRNIYATVTDLRRDRTLRGIVLNGRDETERVRLELELTHQAFHDGLTGLANRALFHDRLGRAIARSERSPQPLAVVIVDLDRFKQVNDGLGHGVGDQVLEVIAARFGEVTQPTDTVARLGGDEFALVLDGAGEEDARVLAQRLLAHLREPVEVEGRQLVLDASVGIAVHSGGPVRIEELVRRADSAMYAAKREGGGAAKVFRDDAEFGSGEVDVLELENELRLAIRRREVLVHYQPEVDLDTGEIVGVEALVRWHSSTLGLVMPDRFIPIAERTGLIVPLGEYVIAQACMTTARWLRRGLIDTSFTMWVNVSGRQFVKGGVARFVRDALDRTGVPAQCLGLEATETAIVVDGEAGERILRELEEIRSLGVSIASDDFGTGLASLGQLQRFPIDVLKVDRSFIDGIEHDPKSAVITANLISLAHALNMVAVAEGIETPSQMASVRRLGCDVAQGYLFARPQPAADVATMLADQAVRRRSRRHPGRDADRPLAATQVEAAT